MRRTLRSLLPSLVLAVATATGAHAQSRSESTVLPVWNESGKVEALLLLQPAEGTNIGPRLRFGGGNTLDAAFGLRDGRTLGLLCNRANSLGAISQLADHCMLAAVGSDDGRHAAAGAALTRGSQRFGVSIGSGSGSLPAWLSPGRNGRVEINDLALFGQKELGREAFVSIGGTVARARLIPATDAPGLADEWTRKTLSLGGGYGAFSANVIGRVVDVPGRKGEWRGLGLGITWRTPWSGQVTVGADNLVTRGKNPFSPSNEDEGTVPYVRYEQDL